MNLFEAIVIAIVEGLTEFLPISSTGHMIITEKLLGVPDSDFTKLFTVGIQLGAILAVVVLYWKKFLAPLKTGNLSFYFKLIVAVIPALALGFIFSDKIDAMLESSLTVAITMIAGGVVLLFIDNLFKAHTISEDEKISYPRAFIIGLWQCIAMIPGVSRSAASIIGGMQQKLTRKLAAEFSFFLAVPTMAAATGYKLLKGYNTISSGDLKLFAVGNIVAFIVAMLAIKFFIGFLQKHGFKLFGYYRIIGGLILLALIFTGYIK
ncbi:MAG TPA: undecaprenyl-diphosphate phosphatase [Chitinophagaceae bacterium]|jgi:undecaprenyl-diphosphatase|nr:undecaprenyl-diphosphate phosphatase [Chitinophagaceae bacterium]HMU57452.1 undecaprenyl-diphosphate phosphatase [Chitinophagaceae bacterium]